MAQTATDVLPKIQLTNIVPVKNNLISETAWLENKVAFTNETLLNISRMLERRFDVEFEFSDAEVRDYTYTGIFERESLERILYLISTTEGFSYTINGQKIIISK